MTTLERHDPVLQPHDQAAPIRLRRIGTQLKRSRTNGRELVEKLAGEIGPEYALEEVAQAESGGGTGICEARGTT